MLDQLKEQLHNLPGKKRWVDMVTAVLTIPVLITVIVTNMGNLQKKDDKEVSAHSPQPTVEQIIIRETETPLNPEPTANPVVENSSPTPACLSELGEYEIIHPVENENVTADPVCIKLKQLTEGNYCNTVSSYRINNSTWSTYSDDPICLYNMAPGKINLEVKVKSAVSGQEKTFIRNFTYKNQFPQASPTTVQLTPVPSL